MKIILLPLLLLLCASGCGETVLDKSINESQNNVARAAFQLGYACGVRNLNYEEYLSQLNEVLEGGTNEIHKTMKEGRSE